MDPELARGALRIGVFLALTSGVLTLFQPRGSPEQSIGLWTFIASMLFLVAVAARMRRS